jgi:phosphoglycerate dehydrogenase-like enzyme
MYARTLDSVLYDSDILTVHVPLNGNTNRMFGEYEFKHMKKSAYFINTSRSQIVNGYELRRAIENKDIAGAALDVAEDYSPNLKRSLIKTGKCIISPHIGGNTIESRVKTQAFMAHKIKEYILRTQKVV